MAMAATAKGGYRGIPQSVGRDFIDADRGRHFNHHDHAAKLASGMHKRLASGHGPRKG
jgi:hypothetical protein